MQLFHLFQASKLCKSEYGLGQIIATIYRRLVTPYMVVKSQGFPQKMPKKFLV